MFTTYQPDDFDSEVEATTVEVLAREIEVLNDWGQS